VRLFTVRFFQYAERISGVYISRAFQDEISRLFIDGEDAWYLNQQMQIDANWTDVYCVPDCQIWYHYPFEACSCVLSADAKNCEENMLNRAASFFYFVMSDLHFSPDLLNFILQFPERQFEKQMKRKRTLVCYFVCVCVCVSLSLSLSNLACLNYSRSYMEVHICLMRITLCHKRPILYCSGVHDILATASKYPSRNLTCLQ